MKFSLNSEKEKNDYTPVSKIKKIINSIATIFLIAIFVVALSAMIYILIQVIGGKPPSLFGYRFYFVLTDSMSPTLEPKDVILSKLVEDNTDADYVKGIIHEGDIVTYLGMIGSQSGYITHRVIKSENYDDVIYYDEISKQWMLVTKGDNKFASADAPIPITKLSAVMVSKVDLVSTVYNFVTKPIGYIFLIGIPIVFILGSLVYRIVIIIKTPNEKLRKKSRYFHLSNEEKQKLEEEIALKAIEDYKANEARISEIARNAVEEYKAKNNIKQ